MNTMIVSASLHFEIATEEEVEMIYHGMKKRGELQNKCGGDDPTDGCERATVRCTHDEYEGRAYVSAICIGYPQFDSYYHNHWPGLNFSNPT